METTSKVKSRIIENVNIIQDETGAVAGTGDMRYVFNRLSRECEPNSDGTFCLNSLLFTSPPLETSAKQTITPTPLVQTRSQCDIAKRKLVSNPAADSPDIHDIKPPSNGQEYNPPSLLKAIEPVTKKTKIVRKVIAAGLVPCSERTVWRMIEREATGEVVPKKFKHVGRPSAIGLRPLLMSVSETLKAEGDGATATRNTINEAIDSVHLEALAESGKDTGFVKFG